MRRAGAAAIRLRETFGAGLFFDVALALTGACWPRCGPTPALPLAAGPIALVYRALWVPLLEHKSRTDPKTGLFNSELPRGRARGRAVAAAQRARPGSRS